jgi:probable F420-dependent oxidoreductase
VKFGLYGLHKGENVAPQALARRARLAEDAGFESIWVGDHIALPADAPDPADEPRMEAVVAVSHLAALTSRLRLAFGVIILPQRQPVLLAKQIASIDVLSEGRLIVGIGAGYVEPELQAMGVTLAERGARVDEYLDAMRVLWDEPTASFDGRFVAFAGVMSRPRPVQRPHPPLVLGGHSAAALRRAARVGAGWFGWALSPAEVADAVARLRAAERPAALGDLEITVTPDADLDLDLARRYAEAGVDRLVLQPRASTAAAAEELIAAARDTLIDRV